MTAPRTLIILGAPLACGLAATAVAVGGHGADDGFLFDQRGLTAVRSPDVEHVVRTAPDPATGHGTGRSATCHAGGPGPLRNPWTCVVAYGAGRRVRIAVTVNTDGSYAGRYAGGGAVTGCCIASATR